MAKKRQTFGKMQRERERAEKRERKQEKKEAKKAAAEAGLVFDHETGEYVEPAALAREPGTEDTPPGEPG
ncbi:MAG TPA: hypothetical protein VFL61_04630 [Gaiellaceae bacterium]|nr:hypothetical protein [Gaiellaceae bacterium]